MCALVYARTRTCVYVYSRSLHVFEEKLKGRFSKASKNSTKKSSAVHFSPHEKGSVSPFPMRSGVFSLADKRWLYLFFFFTPPVASPTLCHSHVAAALSKHMLSTYL